VKREYNNKINCHNHAIRETVTQILCVLSPIVIGMFSVKLRLVFGCVLENVSYQIMLLLLHNTTQLIAILNNEYNK